MKKNIIKEKTFDNLQKQRVMQFNQAIEIGLDQLSKEQKIPATKTYDRLKRKIDRIAYFNYY
jgi:hypothetical protein